MSRSTRSISRGSGTRFGSPAVTHYNAAVDVSARNGATIFVNNASSTGKYSAGVLANSSGGPTIEGQPTLSVHAQHVSMTGTKYAPGIVATSTNGAAYVDAPRFRRRAGFQRHPGLHDRRPAPDHQRPGDDRRDDSAGINAYSSANDITIVSGRPRPAGDQQRHRRAYQRSARSASHQQ